MHSDYDVGFRKPPKQHRFKPGQSGNPNGRPKKYVSAVSVLEKPMVMNVGGKKLEVTAFEASLRKTAQSAIEGRLPAIKRFFKHCDDANLLVDRCKPPTSGVYQVPINPEMYSGRDFSESELAEIDRINAGLNKPPEPKPLNEKDAVIHKVANERHLVPAAGRKMTVFELVQHKLRQRAFVERHEPSHAFCEKLLTQTTLDYDAPTGGFLIVSAPIPPWLSSLRIEDVETGEEVRVPSPGEPGFDPDAPYGFGRG